MHVEKTINILKKIVHQIVSIYKDALSRKHKIEEINMLALLYIRWEGLLIYGRF
jgi:hypothetical protein